MNTDQAEQQPLQVSQEQLLTLVRTLISGSRGRVDDEHPLPPGPWDPIIRVALERLSVFGPHHPGVSGAAFGASIGFRSSQAFSLGILKSGTPSVAVTVLGRKSPSIRNHSRRVSLS